MKRFEIDYILNDSPAPEELVGEYLYIKDITQDFRDERPDDINIAQIKHYIIKPVAVINDDNYPHFEIDINDSYKMIEPLWNNSYMETFIEPNKKMLAQNALPVELRHQLEELIDKSIPQIKSYPITNKEFNLWNGREVYICSEFEAKELVRFFKELNDKKITTDQIVLN